MFRRSIVRDFERAVAGIVWLSSVLMAPVVASAAIVSSGDVKPEFMLLDTIGSSKNHTQPVYTPDGFLTATRGGVYIADIEAGRLDIDNGWTLNTTFGILANTITSGFPDGGQLFITEESTWNIYDHSDPGVPPPDFDIGLASTASVSVNGGSTLSVAGQTRIGTLASGAGVAGIIGSTLNTGSLIVGVEGGGQLAVSGSILNTGWIDLGREISGLGTLTLSAADVNSAGGINVGIRGRGILNASGGTTITSFFANLGIDFNVLDGPSGVATAFGRATLSGPGTVWNNSDGFGVGFNTDGSLTIEAGATLTTGYLEVSRFGGDGDLTVDNGTLTMAMNPSFTATPALLIGTASGSVGTATFTGPNTSVTVADDGFIEIARGSSDSSLNVSDGADVSTHNTHIATEVGSVGALTLTDPGTTWTGSGFVDVARFGHGTLNVLNGAAVTSDSLNIGLEAGSVANATFSGPNTAVTVADDGFIEVARRSADASLDVTNGADVSTHHTIIATEIGSVGVVNLDGAGTTWTGTGSVEVGRFGEGTLNVSSGAVVSSENSIIASGADSISTATITGPGSAWNTAGSFEIARAGDGALHVTGGASVHVGGVLFSASEPGSSGAINLTGSALVPDPVNPGQNLVVPSTIVSDFQISIAGFGQGMLSVSDGAQLISNKATSPTGSSALIAWLEGSTGAAEISGPGTTWTGDGAVNVGFQGAGTLDIEQGGRVESVDGVIARLPGSSGMVRLTGNDSAWLVESSLYVGGRPASLAPGDEGTAGPGGAANLTVGAGAYVAVGDSIEVFAGNSIDVSTGGSVTVGQGPPEGQSGALHIYAGGALSGGGNVEGNVINQGAIAPGSSPGILTVDGDYTQSGGSLLIEIAGTLPGTGFDVLNVTGDATLAGGASLIVELINGFVPQPGDSFDFLALAGALTGTFSTVDLPTLSGGRTWNTSQLYTTGALSVSGTAVAGDYNGDGTVNAADYTVWRDTLGSTTNLAADGNGNNAIDAGDYDAWIANFGHTSAAASSGNDAAVPEPSAMFLLSAALFAALAKVNSVLRRAAPVATGRKD